MANPESDFQYSPNNLSIVGYNGTSKDVIIPSTIGGQPVEMIGSGAFYGRGLTSVVIPESIYYIEYSAFENNNFHTVTILGKGVALQGASQGIDPFDNYNVMGIILVAPDENDSIIQLLIGAYGYTFQQYVEPTEPKPRPSDSNIIRENFPDGDMVIVGDLVEYPPELEGGRNLIPKIPTPGQSAGEWVMVGVEALSPYRARMINGGRIAKFNTPVQKNTIYTLQISRFVDELSKLDIRVLKTDSTSIIAENIVPTGDLETYNITFNTLEEFEIIVYIGEIGGESTVGNFRLIKGVADSSFTPAPEDLGLIFPDWVTHFKYGQTKDGFLMNNFVENPELIVISDENLTESNMSTYTIAGELTTLEPIEPIEGINNLIDVDDGTALDESTIVLENNPEYYRVRTITNGTGLVFPVELEPNTDYIVKARIEIESTTGAGITLTVWNDPGGTYTLYPGDEIDTVGMHTMEIPFNSGNVQSGVILEFTVQHYGGSSGEVIFKVFKEDLRLERNE